MVALEAEALQPGYGFRLTRIGAGVDEANAIPARLFKEPLCPAHDMHGVGSDIFRQIRKADPAAFIQSDAGKRDDFAIKLGAQGADRGFVHGFGKIRNIAARCRADGKPIFHSSRQLA